MAGDIGDWSDDEMRMFEAMDLPDSAMNDTFLHLYYDMALFSPELDHETHVLMRNGLVDYLRDEYGLDLDDAFPWDDYRASGESDA